MLKFRNTQILNDQVRKIPLWKTCHKYVVKNNTFKTAYCVDIEIYGLMNISFAKTLRQYHMWWW